MDLYLTPGHLIRRCQQIAVAIFMEETAASNITPPQFAALAALAEHPGIDQRRLADAIAFDRSTIGDLVARLESRGLVTRTVGDDRRTKRLALTPAGDDLLQTLEAAVARTRTARGVRRDAGASGPPPQRDLPGPAAAHRVAPAGAASEGRISPRDFPNRP